MLIGIAIGIRAKRSVTSWTASIYILKSGAIWYKREINNAGGYFKLWYSSDSGGTWQELFYYDLTESLPLIDLTHIYRHRIVSGEYRIDETITPTGYTGIEGTDWQNVDSFSG